MPYPYSAQNSYRCLNKSKFLIKMCSLCFRPIFVSVQRVPNSEHTTRPLLWTNAYSTVSVKTSFVTWLVFILTVLMKQYFQLPSICDLLTVQNTELSTIWVSHGICFSVLKWNILWEICTYSITNASFSLGGIASFGLVLRLGWRSLSISLKSL